MEITLPSDLTVASKKVGEEFELTLVPLDDSSSFTVILTWKPDCTYRAAFWPGLAYVIFLVVSSISAVGSLTGIVVALVYVFITDAPQARYGHGRFDIDYRVDPPQAEHRAARVGLHEKEEAKMTRWIAIAFFFAHSATGLPSVGWVESASVFLPNGKTVEMEVKVDTGAQTSSLHATKVKKFTKDKEEWVRFSLNGHQVEAPLAKTAEVKSSDGDGERRYFVEVSVCLGSSKLHILVSLNDRSNMSYKALIGRHFLKHKFLVDSSKAFVLGKPACTP